MGYHSNLHIRADSDWRLCAGSCGGPSRARSWRALWGLTERGEAGSAEGSAGGVRALPLGVLEGPHIIIYLDNGCHICLVALHLFALSLMEIKHNPSVTMG